MFTDSIKKLYSISYHQCCILALAAAADEFENFYFDYKKLNK